MKIYQFLLIVILLLTRSIVHGRLYTLIGDLISFFLDQISIEPILFPFYPQKSINQHAEYDFIVVGASPSGAVIANRLTENPNVNILLLEAGEEPSFVVDIPIIAGAIDFTNYNYGYKTEPQDGFCKGCTDGRMEWFHGKGIGGSSLINFMVFVRGNSGDYDKWADQGNPGWSYKEMLPYLIKMEDAHVKFSDTEYRGKGGPLTVSDISYRTEMVQYFVNASVEAGHEYVDYNGKTQNGVSFLQGTIRNGKRCSAEKAYLRPVRRRKNLRIQTNSKVTKILIHADTKTAYGVEYLHKGKRYSAHAKKEVILSAGVLNSPQVLMLSGIGPKDHLEEIGIPVIKDLPVGKKMYDHATFPAIMFEVNKSVVLDALTLIINPLNYVTFLQGSGPFSSIGIEALAYIKTNISTDPLSDYPDIELLMLGTSLTVDYGIIFRKIFNIPPDVYDKLFGPLIGKHVYQVTPILLHPKSCGWMKLNKTNPEGAPLFYANYYSDPENLDIKTLIAGIREVQRINTMPSLQKLGAKIVDIPVPGCEGHIFNSDDYWECSLRTLTASYYHQVSTCKMGPESDPEAVVDHMLRVYGIKNLRVIDTSVIPVTPSAHTVAMAYVIGEKAADLLKDYWEI